VRACRCRSEERRGLSGDARRLGEKEGTRGFHKNTSTTGWARGRGWMHAVRRPMDVPNTLGAFMHRETLAQDVCT
jgi:hypothetical protein